MVVRAARCGALVPQAEIVVTLNLVQDVVWYFFAIALAAVDSLRAPT